MTASGNRTKRNRRRPLVRESSDRWLDGLAGDIGLSCGDTTFCGVDRDDIAVEIAKKNLMLNKIDRKFFSVYTGNLVEGIEKKYDFVVANILTHVIFDLLDDIQRVIKEKGIFVCSGILEENKDLVVAKMKDIGFEILESASKEQWVAICGRFKE